MCKIVTRNDITAALENLPSGHHTVVSLVNSYLDELEQKTKYLEDLIYFAYEEFFDEAILESIENEDFRHWCTIWRDNYTKTDYSLKNHEKITKALEIKNIVRSTKNRANHGNN